MAYGNLFDLTGRGALVTGGSMAGTILYLASDASSNATGTCGNVDGGLLARGARHG